MLNCKLNLVNYVGGKAKLADKIISLLDYTKDCYVELFGGSAKVLLNKPKHPVEWYNDKDKRIYTLMKVVANRYSEFVNRLKYVLFHEALLKDMREMLKTCEDEVDIAVAVFIILNMSFSAKGTSFSFSVCSNDSVSFFNKVDNLDKIFHRLRNVVFFNRDYKDILDIITDKENVMIYVDPPYFGKEKYYKIDFTENDHVDLANRLNKVAGSVLISYYRFDGIEDLYPTDKWTYIECERVNDSYGVTRYNKEKNRGTVRELIIMNYKKEGLYALQDNQTGNLL